MRCKPRHGCDGAPPESECPRRLEGLTRRRMLGRRGPQRRTNVSLASNGHDFEPGMASDFDVLVVTGRPTVRAFFGEIGRTSGAGVSIAVLPLDAHRWTPPPVNSRRPPLPWSTRPWTATRPSPSAGRSERHARSCRSARSSAARTPPPRRTCVGCSPPASKPCWTSSSPRRDAPRPARGRSWPGRLPSADGGRIEHAARRTARERAGQRAHRGRPRIAPARRRGSDRSRDRPRAVPQPPHGQAPHRPAAAAGPRPQPGSSWRPGRAASRRCARLET